MVLKVSLVSEELGIPVPRSRAQGPTRYLYFFAYCVAAATPSIAQAYATCHKFQAVLLRC
jgi:hypothetical protein